MGSKVIQSDAGGVYDQMALQIANTLRVSGLNRIESQIPTDEAMVHLLIYKVKDGLMAVSFSHIDSSRYAGYRQYGRATIGFLQNGKWTFLKNPERR